MSDKGFVEQQNIKFGLSVAERDTPPEPERKSSASTTLEVEGLSVVYGKRQQEAVRDVSVSLQPRDCGVIFGPSGSGKTTLLRAFEGSVEAKSGSVKRNGRVALIYQDLRLIKEKTVLFNTCCGALSEENQFVGFTGFDEETRTKARSVLAELGLQELADQKVARISGGQRQRVAIARALMSDPSVILADEPVAALDRRNALRVMRLLLELQKIHGFSLLVSIHDPGMAEVGFNRAFHMVEGELKEVPLACVPSLMALDPDDCDEPEQDRALLDRNTFFDAHAGTLLGLLLVTMALWSSFALNLGTAEYNNAVNGVFNFIKSVIPDSRAELTNLPWSRLALSLIETAQMAFLGTLIGIVISLPLAGLASRTISPRPIRYATRLLLNTLRTIPALFWGLIFVAAVGLGPVSGTMALAAYSIGYLGKFFYEALESLDNRPMMALRSLGASRTQSFMTAVFPAVRPYLINSCLFMLEYNIRSASILGIVGAGGIGQDLMYFFEWRQFPQAAAGLLLILVVVIVLDILSDRWRKKLVNERGQ